MKHTLILLIAVICSCFSAFAQESNNNDAVYCEPSIYYVEVYEINSHPFKSVCINFGLNTDSIAKTFKLTDEEGKNPIPFENVVGALNYLGQQGWEVMTVYHRELKGTAGQNTYYLMRFDASKHPKTTLVKAIDEQVLANLK